MNKKKKNTENNPSLTLPQGEGKTDFLLYTTPNGNVRVEVLLRDENIWMTQEKIAQLFGVQRPAITKHLKNIFETNELNEVSVSSILEHAANDGKISHEVAVAHAEKEYEKFRIVQDREYISDFDREVKKLLGKRGSSRKKK